MANISQVTVLPAIVVVILRIKIIEQVIAFIANERLHQEQVVLLPPNLKLHLLFAAFSLHLLDF